MRERHGVEVSAGRVRQVCLTHASVLAKVRPVPCTQLRAHGPAWIVAEADGSMVPIVATGAFLAGGAGGGGASARGGHDPLRRHAGWGDRGRRALPAPAGRYLLDLCHVWPGAKATVHVHRDAPKAGQVAPAVLAALRARLEPPDIPEEAAPARSALRYLENRRDQLDCPAALQHHLPVGSGLIESAYRHLLQARLKLAGAWWTEPNVHAMAQLRVCCANHLWDACWSN